MAGGLSLSSLEVIRAARSKFDTGITETQGRRAYNVRKVVLETADEVELRHTYEWTIRRAKASNSFGNFEPFGQVTLSRGEYDVSLSNKPRHWTTHQEMSFDDIQLDENRGSADKLFDIYKNARSANDEDAAEMEDNQFFNVPYSDSASGIDGLQGLLYWFGRSMTSVGVFTAQRTCAKNGVWNRLGNGALNSTVANADRSLAINSRLRNYVGTHEGIVDKTLLTALRDVAIDMNVEYLPELTGKKPAGAFRVLWAQAMQKQFDEMMDDSSGPKMGEYYYDMGGKTPVRGMTFTPCPVLDGHFLLPIIGFRPSNLRFRKLKNRWRQEKTVVTGITSSSFPRLNGGVFKCEEPGNAGFLIHGSFSTGT